jgi:hypothetical protein
MRFTFVCFLCLFVAGSFLIRLIRVNPRLIIYRRISLNNFLLSSASTVARVRL